MVVKIDMNVLRIQGLVLQNMKLQIGKKLRTASLNSKFIGSSKKI